MCRTEISGGVISARHFDPPRRSTQPRVGDHGEDRQSAHGEFEPVGVDLGHHESIVDDADQQGSDDGAEHGPDAAAQRGSPDHRRGDRLELEPVADRGQRRMQAEHLNDATKAGHHGTQHEAEQFVAMSAEAANAIARNQMNEARNSPPGPTNWVNSPVARSSGSKGGKPPEITTVSERTMNSMPRVAMKLGMAKVKVMNPFANPIAAARRSPSRIAAGAGTPAMIKSDVAIGVSANVEPTERSNSPQIIRIVTPIETRPTSGSSPRMPRRLSVDRKAPAEPASNTAASKTSSATPASSGFSR